jgi:hypothetical protein
MMIYPELIISMMILSSPDQSYSFKAGDAIISVNNKGQVDSIFDIVQKKQYLPEGKSAPLLTIAVREKVEYPTSLIYDELSNQLRLSYGESGISAIIKLNIKPTHVTFELESIDGADPIVVMWGPYPTTISHIIGETVGVVRDEKFAFGIQTLNRYTLGGNPSEYANLGFGSESNAALPTEFGSVVQAFSKKRDEGVKGSKIALFGCPSDQALETIGKIEVAEGLPHPMLDGEWSKISTTAKRSYLITNFGENNLDEVLAYANKAGLKYIYHEGPFKTWGHFQLHPDQFPDGDESMRRCVQKAEKAGIRIGIHTLTNFTTTSDPYITPIPDPRLMRIGSSTLIADIDDKATEISVADKMPFMEKQWLSTAVIGEELVQYGEISETEPWRLTDCKRGAFGTSASAHKSGSDIGKLSDHPYRIFFPNLEMQDELTARLVELFNNTGLRQISFDGLEGCLATGYGFYAENKFVQQCYDGWKQEVINDASGLSHYLWHIHTRMNWGEPWGKAMREGMAEYRFKNQEYFNRNLFPRMLGWFLVRTAEGDLEATALDDVEWVMTKCAGYDAGCAVFVSLNTLKRNGKTDEMLIAISEWEKARISGAFSAEQREKMKKSEYHLESNGEEGWKIYPVEFSSKWTCRYEERQPGQPSGMEYEFENKFDRQPLRFVMRILSSGNTDTAFIVNPSLEIGVRKITFPVKLKPQQYLVCDDDKKVQVYDINWNLVQTLELDSELPGLLTGKCRIEFNCEFEGEPKPFAEIRLQTMGNPELVK